MTNWTQGISVIVPTFKRPDSLAVALQSLMGQSAEGRPVEIVVADNDPAGSAKDFIQRFARDSTTPIIYRHVPEPGVANARNGAMDVARGRFIIFLDDDMEALPGWLCELVKTSVTYEAGVVFSAAIAVMPNKDDPLNEYMKPFFSSSIDAPEGLIDCVLGSGGALIDRERCELPTPVFDTDHNETGGEDDALFNYLRRKGAKIAWASGAKAWEHVPAKRANPDYIWKRNFAYGQGPTQTQADKGAAGTLGVAKWMIVGALQFAIYGPLMLILKALGRPRYIHYYARTSQALGKMFWWQNFTPKLYGANATTESPAV